MNKLTGFAAGITEKRGLFLILTKDKARKSKTDLIAHLILSGPLFVVSGDEWLPSFSLPRILREQTTELKTVMSRLRSVRASTCYRLWDSLATMPLKGEPILVLDLLHTFYDSDIPLRTRLFRLRECCRELKRLAFYRPILVMIQEVAAEDYEKFMPAFYGIIDRTLTLEPEQEQTQQLTLL